MAVAALVAIPAAASQPTVDVSLTLEALPATATTNDTAMLVPFDVSLRVAQGSCLGQSATYTVELTAAIDGATSGNGSSSNSSNPSVTAVAIPAELPFSFGPTETVVGTTRTYHAAIQARRDAAAVGTVNATAIVHARIVSLTGCGPTAFAEGFDTEASVDLSFQETAVAQDDGIQAMPSLGGGLLALALAALAVVVRRRA